MKASYFLFNLNQHLSAIEAAYVEEVFALPELTLIPDAPLGIIGVVNLRGEILPVVRLQTSIERQSQRYQLTDSVVVLRQDHLRVGIIVNTVHDIKELPTQEINQELANYLNHQDSDGSRFFSGMIADEEDIFILSDPAAWFNAGEIEQIVSITSFLLSDPHNDSHESFFCPDATLEEQITFRQRAESLGRSLAESQSNEDLKTLVVVVIGDRYFGIDSQIVREFITVQQAMPIPCCPSHIIGNINLRGEILTVVDISKPLNLSIQDLSKTPKAIVAEFEDTPSAVIIEEVRDAMFSVSPSEIQKVFDTTFSIKPDYIQGVVQYDNQMMHILDLPTLLRSNELVVNEIL